LNTAYLLIGGNLGNRFQNLTRAIEAIHRYGHIAAISAVYETAAWGVEDQPAFLNQVIELHTDLAPQPLMTQLLAIEHTLGRVRDQKFGPRLIDIDILLLNNEVINTASLTVPHPALHLRRFALTPLAELAGNKLHPVFNKTITQLLEACTDKLDVKKIMPEP